MADEVRTGQSGVLAWIDDERVRVGQDGILVWLSGQTPVRVGQDGILAWVGQLGKPRLSIVADDEHQMTLTIAPGLGATNHKLYRGTECDGDFPLDGAHLLDDALGATPSPYVDSGLDEATDYWYVIVAEDTALGLERASDPTLGHTPGYGTQASVGLDQLSQDGAILRMPADDPTALHTRWEITLAADTCYDSPVLTHTDPVPSTRTIWDLSGLLEEDVQYRAHGGFVYPEGDGDYSVDVVFTPSKVRRIGGFTSHRNGQDVAGGAINLEWDLLDPSSADGDQWRPLAVEIWTPAAGDWAVLVDTGFPDSTVGDHSFDSTVHADGPVMLRIQARNQSSAKVTYSPTLLLVIDNGGNFDSFGVANGAGIDGTNWPDVVIYGDKSKFNYGMPGSWADGMVALLANGEGDVVLPGADGPFVEEFQGVVSGMSWTAGGLLWWLNQQAAMNAYLRLKFIDENGDEWGKVELIWVNLSHGNPACSHDPYVGSGLVFINFPGVDLQIPITVTGSHAWNHCGRRKLIPHTIYWGMLRPDPVEQPDLYNWTVLVQGYLGDYVFETGQVEIPGGVPCGFLVPSIARIDSVGSGAVTLEAFSAAGVEGACALPPDGEPTSFDIEAAVECDCVTLTAPAFLADGAISARWRVTTAEDTEFATPVFDSEFQAEYLEAHPPVCELEPDDYIADVTFKAADDSENQSNAVAFTIQDNSPPGLALTEQPTDGQVFTDPTAIPYRFAAATDPDGDDLEYESRYSIDGGESYTIFAELGSIAPDTDHVLDFSGIPPGVQIIIEQRAFDGCLYGPPDQVCILIDTVCPEESVNVTHVRRVEIHTDFRDLQGIRVGFMPDFLVVEDDRELQGLERVTLRIPRKSRRNDAAAVWSKLLISRVLRLYYLDLTWDEWRIVDMKDGRDENGAMISDIELEAPGYDLGKKMLQRVEENGLVQYEFGLHGRTFREVPEELARQAGPMWHVGYISPLLENAIVDLDVSWTTVLEGIVQLQEHYANDHITIEREFKRTCAGYNMNFEPQTGAPGENPVAAIGATPDPGDPLTITFSGASSTAPSGMVVLYEWSVLDDEETEIGSGTGEEFEFEFPEEGDYTVVLTVTDNGARTGETQQPVSIATSEGEGFFGGEALGSFPLGG